MKINSRHATERRREMQVPPPGAGNRGDRKRHKLFRPFLQKPAPASYLLGELESATGNCRKPSNIHEKKKPNLPI